MKEYDSLETVSSPSASSGIGKFALLTVTLVTAMLIVGMIADHQRVALALVCGLVFFSLFGGLVILAETGQLATIIVSGQREKTTRIRDRMQYSLYVQPAVEQPAFELVEPAQLPDQRFIPAIPNADEGVKIASYDFVYNLYSGGAIDETRVLPKESKSPGQIQFKKPRGEVVEYLLSLGMVRVGENRMLFFDYIRYPTLVEAKRAIKHGIRRE